MNERNGSTFSHVSSPTPGTISFFFIILLNCFQRIFIYFMVRWVFSLRKNNMNEFYCRVQSFFFMRCDETEVCFYLFKQVPDLITHPQTHVISFRLFCFN